MEKKQKSTQTPGKKPFFARYLERQELERAAGNATLKYPSDRDEYVTMKYPSDNDESIGSL